MMTVDMRTAAVNVALLQAQLSLFLMVRLGPGQNRLHIWNPNLFSRRLFFSTDTEASLKALVFFLFLLYGISTM